MGLTTDKISITAIASISPLGETMDDAWQNYQNNVHLLTLANFEGNGTWVGRLPETISQKIEELRHSDSKYQHLDKSVLYALYASRKAVASAGWSKIGETLKFGINIGSSRGATDLFEHYHEDFLKHGKLSSLASPTTTLGNISSWVAHDLGSRGPEFSHSITCSTALHALLNGVAWLQGGMADRFLVGGSEAPLTPFTIAQMKALKIYASSVDSENSLVAERSRSYPCRALDLDKKRNSMVMGEGASVACLEKGISNGALAVIEGIGYATELLEHNVSISTNAKCFQKSMEMALKDTRKEEVDVIVMHAPGTLKGDASEMNAIQKVFCNHLPFLTTNKWKIGHSFGASGMLNIEMALLMLQHQKVIAVPFHQSESKPKSIKKVLVNAVGFGGNAVSILLSKV
ncbi:MULTISPECIES: beta-ketoacyl synthase N-terminal-like domain-containing protein [Maribacter]|uniref:Beta-ketoacyl synthase N-terminal-like domain-containing protein n=1 Tax=Maribacter flavus TaxID=1658664 RepID=A0ABU7IF88_9FLAO|nr:MULTISPECIES: beta-ketoacyl synthase N-terminal-like domain-containing protein [Maribacter]MDC6404473.1 beta-ketoacyl synthase N-terminal-like domain-containing protein [Maribacter sp. PR66]MEE1971617.1 beta-ketoacyl synthase N-terminal-like domain-containing protein [Maribacter flavus]